MDGPSLSSIGRLVLILGLGIAALGIVLLVLGKLPGASVLGKLPGDFVWRGKNGTVYFPLATCLLISVIVSLLLHLFKK